MLQLGELQFSVDTQSYEELSRKVEYRWPILERLQRRPAHQFLGVGEETITLKGCVFPLFDPYGFGSVIGTRRIEEIRQIAAQGTPQDLLTGTGDALGKWVISGIEENQTVLMPNGAPKKQDYTVRLDYYGDSGFGLDGVVFSDGVFSVPQNSDSAGSGSSSGVTPSPAVVPTNTGIGDRQPDPTNLGQGGTSTTPFSLGGP